MCATGQVLFPDLRIGGVKALHCLVQNVLSCVECYEVVLTNTCVPIDVREGREADP